MPGLDELVFSLSDFQDFGLCPECAEQVHAGPDPAAAFVRAVPDCGADGHRLTANGQRTDPPAARVEDLQFRPAVSCEL